MREEVGQHKQTAGERVAGHQDRADKFSGWVSRQSKERHIHNCAELHIKVVPLLRHDNVARVVPQLLLYQERVIYDL